MFFSYAVEFPVAPSLGILDSCSDSNAGLGRLMMEKLSIDELLRWAGRMAQDVIAEISVADSALDLLIHDEAVSLETRGKLSLLREQVRQGAAPAKRFILISRTQEDVEVLNLQEFFSDLYPLVRRLVPDNVDFQMELATDLWPTRANIRQFEEAFLTIRAASPA